MKKLLSKNNKTTIDPKVHEVFSRNGKKGMKVARERDPEFNTKGGKKSWENRLKKEGREGISKRMSEVRRAGIEKAKKRKEEEEKKKKRVGIAGRLSNFFNDGRID